MDAGATEIFLADETATARLGEDIAAAVRPGDVIALEGELGAGKSTLARGLIRALAADPALDVPSPTFTLVQSYAARIPVHHFDLYRVQSADELEELGLDEALDTGVVLVEWPEKAGGRLPADAARIALAHRDDGRLALLSAAGPLGRRIERSLEIRRFLEAAGCGAARRTFLLGDASTRAYETIGREGQASLILMNAPQQPDGPPIRDGKPYSRIAHLAESVIPFVAIDRALAAGGVTVPEIHASDLDKGLLLLEHLGSETFLRDGRRPVAERYELAAELLAKMHGRTWPAEIEVAPGVRHHVPPYDRGAMMIEAELLLDWYLPFMIGRAAKDDDVALFRAAWNAVLDRLDGAEKSLVLRDYHSPNIVWREDREGFDRLGVLDFQDALIGPSAYDVASLAQDARVDISGGLEARAVAAYCRRRAAAGAFDEDAFREAYAIMAAQRCFKLLGIFVRLDRRDGKPAYLAHLPRIREYLSRSLVHPALAPVATWLRDMDLLDGDTH